MKPAALKMFWVNCVERLKDRVNQRSFWEAVESAHAITVESNILIIGLESQNFNRASHLQQPANAHTINEVVSEVFGQPLQVRVIEGITLQDWEDAKAKDAHIAAMKQSAAARGVQEDRQLSGWEGLYEQIARMYMTTAQRSLPQGKARYANDALYTLAEAMDELYGDTPDETGERNLARTLERISNNTDIPSPVLAFELERIRVWRKASMESGE